MAESEAAILSPQVARHLDFVSVHFYPKEGQVEETLKALATYDIGKPLVVEETFPLSCSLGKWTSSSKGLSLVSTAGLATTSATRSRNTPPAQTVWRVHSQIPRILEGQGRRNPGTGRMASLGPSSCLKGRVRICCVPTTTRCRRRSKSTRSTEPR